MLALKQQCIHPDTKTPYILSCKGGRNISSEAGRADYSYGFVLEFKDKDDWTFYLKEDPAHQAFVKKAMGGVEKVGVVDFEEGVA